MGKPRRRNGSGLDKKTRAFYCNAIRTLQKGEVRCLVGGAYAFSWYTGIERHTNDFDIFVQPEDCESALRTLAAAGYRTELTHPHWLGKAYCGDAFVDVIYSSGNGMATVDDLWFEHAPEVTLLDLPVRLVPAEEMIWSKAFIMERERFDGADVAHLLKACARDLDWPRLLWRFRAHWRVLYGHLVLVVMSTLASGTCCPAPSSATWRGGWSVSWTARPPTRRCAAARSSRASGISKTLGRGGTRTSASRTASCHPPTRSTGRTPLLRSRTTHPHLAAPRSSARHGLRRFFQ